MSSMATAISCTTNGEEEPQSLGDGNMFVFPSRHFNRSDDFSRTRINVG